MVSGCADGHQDFIGRDLGGYRYENEHGASKSKEKRLHIRAEGIAQFRFHDSVRFTSFREYNARGWNLVRKFFESNFRWVSLRGLRAPSPESQPMTFR